MRGRCAHSGWREGSPPHKNTTFKRLNLLKSGLGDTIRQQDALFMLQSQDRRKEQILRRGAVAIRD